mgnify:CR=1 FL=1
MASPIGLERQFREALAKPDAEGPGDRPMGADEPETTCPTCGASMEKIREAASTGVPEPPMMEKMPGM